MGIYDNGTDYRLVLSTFLNGSQLNIQPAVVLNKQDEQVSYKQIYFIKTTIFSDDLSDNYTTSTKNDACSSNPCKNGGVCIVGFANTFACVCSNLYTGFYLKFF
jgi:hypothetical protein